MLNDSSHPHALLQSPKRGTQNMANENRLSRRERQIMDILYAHDGATTMEVWREMPDPPTDMAIRRLLHILEEKGHVRRRKRGREFVYVPKRSKGQAGRAALKHVLDTFFGGALDEALAAHLGKKESDLSQDQLRRIQEIIEKVRREGK